MEGGPESEGGKADGRFPGPCERCKEDRHSNWVALAVLFILAGTFLVGFAFLLWFAGTLPPLGQTGGGG